MEPPFDACHRGAVRAEGRISYPSGMYTHAGDGLGIMTAVVIARAGGMELLADAGERGAPFVWSTSSNRSTCRGT